MRQKQQETTEKERKPAAFFCNHYIVGVDVGLTAQHTAIAVIEQENRLEGRFGAECVEMRLRHLERTALGAPHPGTVERIKELMEALKEREGDRHPWRKDEPQSDVVVDITGAGPGLVGLLKDEGIAASTIIITGGAAPAGEQYDNTRISKVELIGNLQVLFQTERLKVAKALPLAETFTDELQNFKLKPPATADDFEAWREGQHDDLVFAVAVAAWRGCRYSPQPRIDINKLMPMPAIV